MNTKLTLSNETCGVRTGHFLLSAKIRHDHSKRCEVLALVLSLRFGRGLPHEGSHEHSSSIE